MSIFSNILFPVDFSGQCAQTACSVAAVARQFKSKVTLITRSATMRAFIRRMLHRRTHGSPGCAKPPERGCSHSEHLASTNSSWRVVLKTATLLT